MGIFVEHGEGKEFSGSRMLQKAISILLVLLPLIFGEETFECCPLKEVQGEGPLAGVYYLVETDQPFPDVCSLDDCTYKKEGNGDEKFCFKPSARYESTCPASGEGYGYASGEPSAETSGEPSAEPTAEPSAESGAEEASPEPTGEPSSEPTSDPGLAQKTIRLNDTEIAELLRLSMVFPPPPEGSLVNFCLKEGFADIGKPLSPDEYIDSVRLQDSDCPTVLLEEDSSTSCKERSESCGVAIATTTTTTPTLDFADNLGDMRVRRQAATTLPTTT